MGAHRSKPSLFLLVIAAWIGGAGCALAAHAPASSIPAANLIEPSELAARLQSPSAEKPLILQVGSRLLYSEAHIVGAEYAGPGGDAAGLRVLRSRVARLPKGALIVIYCGCCPWDRCPNIAPAFNELRLLRFTRVEALHIADNFGVDWVQKGYPALKGR